MIVMLNVFSVLLITSSTLSRPVRQTTEAEEFDEFLQSTVNGEPEQEFDEVFDDKQNSWEQSGKFEGDMILSKHQRQTLLDEVSQPGLARNGLKDVSKRWPKNTLIYSIIEDDFTSDQMSSIKDAMGDIERSTCLKFKEKDADDDDYVEIHGARRGCFSQVGFQGNGRQVLNLTPHPTGSGCMRHGTIVHELMHSLGFFHMQSATDRDKYVKIVWDNIIDGRENNFKKYNSFVTSDFGVPYDYDSVLHYSAYAFSKNGKETIVPTSDDFVTIGQRSGMSDKDILKLNRMYECEAPNEAAHDSNDEDLSDNKKSDYGFSWENFKDELFPKSYYEFKGWWEK